MKLKRNGAKIGDGRQKVMRKPEPLAQRNGNVQWSGPLTGLNNAKSHPLRLRVNPL
jgi:hypothetical protein